MQSPTTKLIEFFARAKHSAQATRHRLTITLIGDGQWCRDTAQQYLADPQHEPALWLTQHPITNTHCIPSAKAHHYLGQEFNTLVYDGHSGIDADAIAAISGTLKGGGLFVLLLPCLDELATFDDPQRERLCSWPYQANDVQGRFLDRLEKMIAADTQIARIYQDNTENHYPELPGADSPAHPQSTASLFANEQQAELVAAIEHVVRGHRRRPLIITAPRGRGKSAALGIASAQLLQEQRLNHILICAPNPHAVDTLFRHTAEKLQQQAIGHRIDTPTGGMEFIAPDALCRNQPKCDLLIIDEAAAIPIPLLQQMLAHYSRIVFSTTTDGYEGTGRAFAIRFFQILDNQTPDWRHATLSTPIRWAANDPTEAWLFKVLLLDAQPLNEELLSSAELSDCNVEQLQQQSLAQNESDLQQLMGLFLLAHYQTQPNDLRHLLDSPGVEIFVVRHTQHIVAAVVLEQEGAIDDELSAAIYKNQRRLRGHRLPQTLSVYSGFPEACQLRYARVMRIAVHPALHRQGIASKLLQEVTQHVTQTGHDFLGTNYGATVELLSFWQAVGFGTVNLGIKRNASSGAHAATSLMAISKSGKVLLDLLQDRFTDQFSASLSEEHQALEASIVINLLKYIRSKPDPLNKQDHRDIDSFVKNCRGYEVNGYAIKRLASQTIGLLSAQQHLTEQEKIVLVGKVLQNKTWSEIIKLNHISDRKHATDTLRHAITKLYRQYKKDS